MFRLCLYLLLTWTALGSNSFRSSLISSEDFKKLYPIFKSTKHFPPGIHPGEIGEYFKKNPKKLNALVAEVNTKLKELDLPSISEKEVEFFPQFITGFAGTFYQGFMLSDSFVKLCAMHLRK